MDEAGAVPQRRRNLSGSRYELLVKLATGGTSTVYVGRASGSVGFQRLVAIKRAHPHLREDRAARAMLVKEATLASRIHHANVVAIHDVEETDDELLLVMDYVEGGSLADLLDSPAAKRRTLPPRVALRILLDGCAGLAAVHELADDDGRALGLVHRDVSPQNLLVGIDGTSRLADFGLAKPTEVSATATATVKGKLAYLAPEYIEGGEYTQRCDVFSLGVVVWETLAGQRLFRGKSDADTIRRVVSRTAPPLSATSPALGPDFDGIVARALAKRPELRPASVAELAEKLAHAAGKRDLCGSHADVGRSVRERLGAVIDARRQVLRAVADPESSTTASQVLVDLIALPSLPSLASLPTIDPPASVDESEAPTGRMRSEPPQRFTSEPPPSSSPEALPSYNVVPSVPPSSKSTWSGPLPPPPMLPTGMRAPPSLPSLSPSSSAPSSLPSSLVPDHIPVTSHKRSIAIVAGALVALTLVVLGPLAWREQPAPRASADAAPSSLPSSLGTLPAEPVRASAAPSAALPPRSDPSARPLPSAAGSRPMPPATRPRPAPDFSSAPALPSNPYKTRLP